MFPRWVEVLLDANQNWIVIADPGHEGHVFECLGELGYQQIGGYLEGGHASLLAHPERLIRTERVDQAALANELEADQPPHLIDVRQPHEWHAGRIAEAPNIPLTEFEKRCEEVPKDSRIILQCQGGYRSLIAASFLERAGFEDVVDMSGGFGAWVNAGRAVNSAQ
jgi:hydroxyacylglutathione hydrolase